MVLLSNQENLTKIKCKHLRHQSFFLAYVLLLSRGGAAVRCRGHIGGTMSQKIKWGRGSSSILFIFLITGLISSSGVFAAPPSSLFRAPFQPKADGVDRLREAYQTITSDNLINSLIRSGNHALSVAQNVTDAELETTKFQDYYKGVEVVGSMALFHKGFRGAMVSNLISQFDLNTEPTLTAREAVSLAKNIAGDLDLLEAPRLKILPSEEEPSSADLVYWVRLQGKANEPGFDVVVNAQNGKIIASVSHRLTIAPIKVFQATDECQLVHPSSGWPLALDFDSCDLTIENNRALRRADNSARRAANNSLKTLQYYLNRHGRDSFDGRGSTAISIVHVGHQFENAFWDSEKKIMAYGDGDGKITGDFTAALDVAGHEMTHGIVSETAQLLNFGESGALNEAYADFFGKMIANDGDWSMGRNIYLNRSRAKGFRNLANPKSINVTYQDDDGNKASSPYPAHMSERFIAKDMCSKSNDNCWVHVNSTIPGHASYLVVQAIGKDRAERLYYKTLTHFLTQRSNLRTARTATLTACSQLYDMRVCELVSKAFAQVGL
jgi:Zn-dependent metalloprotease